MSSCWWLKNLQSLLPTTRLLFLDYCINYRWYLIYIYTVYIYIYTYVYHATFLLRISSFDGILYNITISDFFGTSLLTFQPFKEALHYCTGSPRSPRCRWMARFDPGSFFEDQRKSHLPRHHGRPVDPWQRGLVPHLASNKYRIFHHQSWYGFPEHDK